MSLPSVHHRRMVEAAKQPQQGSRGIVNAKPKSLLLANLLLLCGCCSEKKNSCDFAVFRGCLEAFGGAFEFALLVLRQLSFCHWSSVNAVFTNNSFRLHAEIRFEN